MNLTVFKSRVGDAVYKRGVKLHESGAVAVLLKDLKRITAKVQGGEDYSVELALPITKQSRGYCNCYAYSALKLCKHCVALALQIENPVEPVAKPLSKSEIDVRTLLQDKSHAQLVDELYALIKNDKAALKRYKLEAQIVAEGGTAKSLKKLITKALPKREIFTYAKSGDYFEVAENCFELFFCYTKQLDKESYLSLLLDAHARLNLVLDTIDDSGGFRLELEGTLADELVLTFKALPWNNTEKINWLIALKDKEWDVCPWVPEHFELSEIQLAMYKKKQAESKLKKAAKEQSDEIF